MDELSGFPITPVVLSRPMASDIPSDVHGEIVDALQGCPATLRALGATSRHLNRRSRPHLFQDVRILSVARLLRLAAVLSFTPFVTIPHSVATLDVDLPKPHTLGDGSDTREVREALASVLDHFEVVWGSVRLDLPWVVSRMLDWWYLGRNCGRIRRFVLTGTHSWPHELVRTLSCMHSLDSLVVDAAWNSEGAQWDFLPTDVALSMELRDVGCSASSLPLLTWMSRLVHWPKTLRTVRIQADGLHSHIAPHRVRSFFDKYGPQTEQVYLWCEEADWLCHETLYRGTSTSLSHP